MNLITKNKLIISILMLAFAKTSLAAEVSGSGILETINGTDTLLGQVSFYVDSDNSDVEITTGFSGYSLAQIFVLDGSDNFVAFSDQGQGFDLEPYLSLSGEDALDTGWYRVVMGLSGFGIDDARSGVWSNWLCDPSPLPDCTWQVGVTGENVFAEPPAEIPVPAAILLFASALTSLGVLGRKRH